MEVIYNAFTHLNTTSLAAIGVMMGVLVFRLGRKVCLYIIAEQKAYKDGKWREDERAEEINDETDKEYGWYQDKDE